MAQAAPGVYELVLGPRILDLAGLRMDQDGDRAPGEDPDDRYAASFDIPFGHYVIAHSPSGDQTEAVTEVSVTFNEPIDLDTFTMADVQIQGPTGTITTIGNPAALGGNIYSITFAEQAAAGDYHVWVGPRIQNLAGHEMDQDRDGIIGEGLEDRYDATFTIIDVAGPRVVAYSPALPVRGTLNQVDFTFNEPLTPISCDLSDVTITGPGGSIAATNVELVQTSQCRVHFPAQTVEGTYLVTIGPHVADLVGNLMDQDEDGNKGETADDCRQREIFAEFQKGSSGASVLLNHEVIVRSRRADGTA